MVPCPACAAPSDPADRFCEACGATLGPEPPPAPPGPPWRSTTAPPGPCGACGDAGFSLDGYCEACGRRRTVGRDRAELALDGVAAVTDRGCHRGHNEDAVAIGRLDGTTVAIVCDGVSSSPHADAASHAAVEAGIAALLRELAGGAPPARATEVAFRAAFADVAELSRPDTRQNPPACTYVSGIVTADAVVVGWVGDSRAYWVPATAAAVQVGEGARQLTDDDSMAGQLALRGVAIGPHLSSNLGALTRWVGADAGPIEARVTSVDRPGPGTLILCSDGLSRYLAGPADLAAVAGWPPDRVARHLTELALQAGGVDNIAVAALPFPPVDPTGEPSP